MDGRRRTERSRTESGVQADSPPPPRRPEVCVNRFEVRTSRRPRLGVRLPTSGFDPDMPRERAIAARCPAERRADRLTLSKFGVDVFTPTDVAPLLATLTADP